MTGRADYAESRQRRIDGLRARAARTEAAGNARIAGAKKNADGIPFGQPILVGHHSEGRDRRFLARIRQGFTKGYEDLKAAEGLERRAEAAESNDAISSDDPEALVKLRAKHEALMAHREFAKRVNAAYRKGGWDAVRPLVSAEAAEQLVRRGQFEPGGFSQPFPSYSLTNLSARIRSTAERIKGLERSAAATPREPVTIGTVTLLEEDNRVLLVFPGKPPEPVRKLLKSYGFRWAPTAGAWSRLANNAARHAAETIARQLVDPDPHRTETPTP